MSTSQDVITIINELTYVGNKYNVFGGIAFYVIAMIVGLIQSPADSTILHKVSAGLFVLACCIVVKTVMHTFFNFTDICECDPSAKAYDRPHLASCPTEKDVNNVFRDTRNLLHDTLLEWGYRFNLLVPFVVLVIGQLCRLFTSYPTFDTMYLFKLLIPLGVFITVKVVINLAFMLQDFCPCRSGQCPAKQSHAVTRVQTPLEQEVQSDIDQTGDIDDSIAQDVKYTLAKAVQKELQQLGNFDSRLNDMCNLAVNKLKRYDTVQNCLAEVQSDPAVKSIVRKTLMDDPTYTCLLAGGNETQFASCFSDYFSRNPQYLLRLANITSAPSQAS